MLHIKVSMQLFFCGFERYNYDIKAVTIAFIDVNHCLILNGENVYITSEKLIYSSYARYDFECWYHIISETIYLRYLIRKYLCDGIADVMFCS